MRKNFTEEELSHISDHFWFRLDFLISHERMSRETFLEKAEMNLRQYQRIKKGNNPTLYSICKMAKVLGVHPMELLNFDLSKIVNRKIEFIPISKPRKVNKTIITKKDYEMKAVIKENFDFKVIKKS